MKQYFSIALTTDFPIEQTPESIRALLEDFLVKEVITIEQVEDLTEDVADVE